MKNTDYIVYGSFIEIYNEKIYDLLVPPSKTGKRDDLRIRQDAKGPFVGNALEIQINTAQESFHIDVSSRMSHPRSLIRRESLGLFSFSMVKY